ncbi:MAG: AbrB/MazE/SpoVT family DNA-binding domain-containing protein [Methanocellales archaeon]|nr:AbrB/MazE/SpoVT family DNA-binding domain-containing protein [Methanocellales archaeon]MDI6902535.1 AbrB/MazE/SpoVT family DNA-binding domain-containing protein [Methanocellales archaeon]
MEYSKVTKKGQVTIPLRLRKLLGIMTGEKVVFEVDGEKIMLKKAPKNPIADLVGLGKGVFGKSLDYQMRIRDEWE